jgi:cephalosporin-C deacetylase-like acetyl esterase
MLLGRTVDDTRLYDVLCAVDYAASRPSFNGELTVVGKGEAGIIGAYAAVLDERVSRVILHSPTLSHKTGPSFLNVLRYTDIPQALALIAPREVVFLTDDIERFNYTRDIFRLYNAGDKFRRGYTVTQVMNVGKRVGE